MIKRGHSVTFRIKEAFSSCVRGAVHSSAAEMSLGSELIKQLPQAACGAVHRMLCLAQRMAWRVLKSCATIICVHLQHFETALISLCLLIFF